MPYLTLISQNLAHLEGNSHKKLKSLRIFRPFYNRFYEEININHTLLRFSQTSYMTKKGFRLYWRSSKVIMKKILQNFVKSSLKSSLKFCYLTDFSPQLKAYMLWKKILDIRQFKDRPQKCCSQSDQKCIAV